MKKTLSISLCVFVLLFVAFNSSFAQKKSKNQPVVTTPKSTSVSANTVLATVAGDPITYGELENAYRRNMNRKNSTLSAVKKDSVMDFLQLYVKYRLKVKDALAREFDKDSSVKAEVAQNKKLLSETYLFDKKVTDPNIEKYVERRKKEIQIAVMVFSIPQGENADTTAAFNKAMRCIDLVKSGADFSKVAKDSSEDKETAKDGGVLPFITSLGGIIKPLEDAAYSLKVGETYSKPVRARSVYIVCKLMKEQARQSVRAAQILISQKDDEDSAACVKRAYSLADMLKSKPRSEFAKIAKEQSEDKSSTEKGGDLGGYYSRSLGMENENRKLMPEFENVLFGLKDGEIGVATTIYGHHIIRRDSTKFYNADDEKDALKKQYKRSNFEEDKRNFLEDTKKKNGYKWDDNVFSTFVKNLEPNKTTFDSTWFKNIPTDILSKNIYVSPTKNFTTQAFVDSLRKRNDMRGISLNKNGLTGAMNKIIDPIVIAEASKNLETEYPDFGSLMREFRDGILLFKVEEQEVWTKLKFDSTLAKVYFDSTKARYQTEFKYDVHEIYFLNDSTAKSATADIKKVTSLNEFETLASTHTQREGYREKKGKWGLISIKNNKLAQAIDSYKPQAGDVIGPISFEKGFSFVRINEVQKPRQKTFEEAIPDFAPTFQDLTQKRLSETWINNLKSKYAVVIDQGKIDSVFTNK